MLGINSDSKLGTTIDRILIKRDPTDVNRIKSYLESWIQSCKMKAPSNRSFIDYIQANGYLYEYY